MKGVSRQSSGRFSTDRSVTVQFRRLVISAEKGLGTDQDHYFGPRYQSSIRPILDIGTDRPATGPAPGSGGMVQAAAHQQLCQYVCPQLVGCPCISGRLLPPGRCAEGGVDLLRFCCRQMGGQTRHSVLFTVKGDPALIERIVMPGPYGLRVLLLPQPPGPYGELGPGHSLCCGQQAGFKLRKGIFRDVLALVQHHLRMPVGKTPFLQARKSGGMGAAQRVGFAQKPLTAHLRNVQNRCTLRRRKTECHAGVEPPGGCMKVLPENFLHPVQQTGLLSLRPRKQVRHPAQRFPDGVLTPRPEVL